MKKGNGKNVSERKSSVALLLVDVINDYESPEAEQLLKHALPMARKIAALKHKCTRVGIPTIYVNDNIGRWRSCLDEQIEHCLAQKEAGRKIVELLLPQPDDYFIFKPKRSAFFETPLDSMLRDLGAKTLILTGVATDNCIYFTASDANMRDYQLFVPCDCVAADSAGTSKQMLEKMASLFHADIRPSDELADKAEALTGLA